MNFSTAAIAIFVSAAAAPTSAAASSSLRRRGEVVGQSFSMSDDYIDHHNEKRGLHVDTPNVVYDATLAAAAQAYADTCPTGHDDSSNSGENLAWSGSSGMTVPVDYGDAIGRWYDEIDDYLWPTAPNGDRTDGPAVGHFTQVVWKATTRVGCGGRDDCANMWTGFRNNAVVCRYEIPGNMGGQFPVQVGQLKDDQDPVDTDSPTVSASDSPPGDTDSPTVSPIDSPPVDTDSPTVSPIDSPPVTPTPPGPAPPGPAPGVPPPIQIDVFHFQFTFTPRGGCVVADDVAGRAQGNSPEQCAQACATLEDCTGFVVFREGEDAGACALSVDTEVDDGAACELDAFADVWYYDRAAALVMD